MISYSVGHSCRKQVQLTLNSAVNDTLLFMVCMCYEILACVLVNACCLVIYVRNHSKLRNPGDGICCKSVLICCAPFRFSWFCFSLYYEIFFVSVVLPLSPRRLAPCPVIGRGHCHAISACIKGDPLSPSDNYTVTLRPTCLTYGHHYRARCRRRPLLPSREWARKVL